MNQEICFSHFTIPNVGTVTDRIPQTTLKVQIEYEPQNASVYIENSITDLHLTKG